MHRCRRPASIRLAIVVLVFALWLVGAVLRDATRWTGLCFYLPSPVVAAALLAGAATARAHGRARAARILAALAVLPLAAILLLEHRWWRRPQEARGGAPVLRVLHWNVYRGSAGWDRAREEILRIRPDLLVLSEPPYEPHVRRLAAGLGGAYSVVRPGPFVVMGRGAIDVVPATPRPRRRGLVTATLAWTCEDVRVRVLLADLPSSVLVRRDPLLREVLRLARRERADLVVGDFNAPRRSRAIARLPRGWAHAYEAAGSGWSATWPMPLPLLDLDQCLVGPRLAAVRYELGWVQASDHRSQLLDLSPRVSWRHPDGSRHAP